VNGVDTFVVRWFVTLAADRRSRRTARRTITLF
jgi:hypothetical protein